MVSQEGQNYQAEPNRQRQFQNQDHDFRRKNSTTAAAVRKNNFLFDSTLPFTLPDHQYSTCTFHCLDPGIPFQAGMVAALQIRMLALLGGKRLIVDLWLESASLKPEVHTW